MRPILCLLLVLSLLALPPAGAAAQTLIESQMQAQARAAARAEAEVGDPHALFESRCAACHRTHAGDFARASLLRGPGGALQGRKTGKDVAAFLGRGHGKLQPGEAEILLAHFGAILDAGGLFQQKCRVCHDSGVGLARDRLVLRDGRLTGRYSGRDIAVFLQNHGRLSGPEVETAVEMLTRNLAGAD